jgi:hypothetical protein
MHLPHHMILQFVCLQTQLQALEEEQINPAYIAFLANKAGYNAARPELEE